MADEGEDREADVVEQPARKPDDMTAVLAVNFRKSRRVMFDCTVVMTMLRCSMCPSRDSSASPQNDIVYL